MTDNEIISISEEYVRRQCENRCEMKNCDACMVNYVKQTIEIARNQKAEIERLTEQKMSMKKDRDYWMVQTRMSREKEKTAKAEAIKGFAKELKTRIKNAVFCCYDARFKNHLQELLRIIVAKIDNLVKEMVGDSDGCR